MLIDDVQQAMFSAMKAREARETAALRLALSALRSAAIDARHDLSDDEAVAASGASGPKELGKVMGRLMPQVKGRADGNEVRRLVQERLGG